MLLHGLLHSLFGFLEESYPASLHLQLTLIQPVEMTFHKIDESDNSRTYHRITDENIDTYQHCIFLVNTLTGECLTIFGNGLIELGVVQDAIFSSQARSYTLCYSTNPSVNKTIKY